jgi:hypothetical protein
VAQLECLRIRRMQFDALRRREEGECG